MKQIMAKSITLSILALLASNGHAGEPNCDPSALTYEHVACGRKEGGVFAIYANADVQVQPDTARQSKELSAVLDEKLEKQDLSRKSRQGDKGYGVSVDSANKPIANGSDIQNRGMETQMEKTEKLKARTVEHNVKEKPSLGARLKVPLNKPKK